MSFFSNLSSMFGSDEDQKTKNTGVKKNKKSNLSRKPVQNIKSNQKHNKAQVKSQKKPKQGALSSRASSNQSQSHPTLDPALISEKANKAAIVREAISKSREIIVEAKDEALAIRSKAEKQTRELEKELSKQRQLLQSKLDRLDNRMEQLENREDQLTKNRSRLDETRKALSDAKASVLKKLEEITGMTSSEARDVLLDGLEKKLSSEMAQMIRQKQEETKQEADEKVREILIDAMKHGATDYVAEYTVSVVALPSEDLKGKIIGKSGRNIHAFERVTGVDVDLDASPTEVKLSSFDPVRREIARVSLEKLIKDGRIQPARIEEIVAKVTKDLDKIMFDAGKKLCHTVGVYNLPNGLIKTLGRFKYRFSYGQNMITHTIEETKIGIKLAHELNLDVNVVKLGCLLHDVGKVAKDPEGSHVEQGVKIAKKYGMPKAVVDCIAQHHEDEPFSGPEQMAVYIADAISGARPGARYENFEEYAQRLGALEEIATQHDIVKQAYAIQAGRELRVLLEPEKSKDDDVTVLSVKIKDEIQEKVTFPGTVKVTVIREKRGQSVAR